VLGDAVQAPKAIDAATPPIPVSTERRENEPDRRSPSGCGNEMQDMHTLVNLS